MKIVKAILYHLSGKLDRNLIWASGKQDYRETLIVKLVTNNGIVGWGETININAFEAIQKMLSQIIDKNPLEIELINQKLQEMFKSEEYMIDLAMCGIGAIDTALWDIMGKYNNRPIYELLGGNKHAKTLLYASGGYALEIFDKLEFMEEINSYVQQGFKAVKIKIGYYSTDIDIERIRIARELMGQDMHLMIDSNQSLNLESTTKLCNSINKYNILWFEEPITIKNCHEYSELRDKSDIAIAAGENFHSYSHFHKFVSENALDIIQPDVGNAGGITEILKLIKLSKNYGVKICPHTWGTNILTAATIHLCSVIPHVNIRGYKKYCNNETIMEYDCTPNPLRSTVCKLNMMINDGYAYVTNKPGLGIEVDEKSIEHYTNKYCIQS